MCASWDSRTLHWTVCSYLWPRHPWAHWLKSHRTHNQRKEFTDFHHILSLCSPGSVHIVEINGTRLCRCCLGEGASLDLAHSLLPSFFFSSYLIIQWIFYCMLPRYRSIVHTSPSFTEHPLTFEVLCSTLRVQIVWVPAHRCNLVHILRAPLNSLTSVPQWFSKWADSLLSIVFLSWIKIFSTKLQWMMSQSKTKVWSRFGAKLLPTW